MIVQAATGKRKCAVARVRLTPGEGKVVVNGRAFNEFFPREVWQMVVLRPFVITETSGQYDTAVSVHGGGISGQASAIRHGIAKALEEMTPPLRTKLKKAGLLTRDPRVKERKKYGQKGARRRFQFSKR